MLNCADGIIFKKIIPLLDILSSGIIVGIRGYFDRFAYMSPTICSFGCPWVFGKLFANFVIVSNHFLTVVLLTRILFPIIFKGMCLLMYAS